MSNLSDLYEAKYGSNAKIFLRTLGGDPNEIIDRVAALYADDTIDTSDSLAAMFGAEPAPEDDAHNMILREIQRLYFSGISRESALAVVEAIGLLGSISICSTIPELTFSDDTYAYAWSTVHPDNALHGGDGVWY